ncbi:MAG: aminoglycoside phosphotransferase family protein [Clostridia bacterium]|nr:aminoglycoside phosphotransferase family protein [Clostridia bacterium]
MIYNEIKCIVENFKFEGEYIAVEELTAGNINNTYKLTFKKPDGSIINYVLQRINTNVFKDPVGLMNNVEEVTSHIADAMNKKGIDSSRRVLRFIRTKDDSLLCEYDGGHWRADNFIENATAHNSISDPRHFYESGRGFGQFQKYLFDFPADKLVETIPNFHNTKKRFETFKQSVAKDPAGRVASVKEEIDFLLEREEKMGKIVDLIESGDLPLRVTHNDTKLNNVMIDDETGEAICVIDLDTVMPGSVLYDYGDAIRFGANTAAEDEDDTSLIGVDMNLFRLFTDGFVSEVKDVLTENEIHYLPLGAWVMTAELVLRFLTDYIDGDVYFKIKKPGHNLIRTRAQKKLLEEMEKHYDEMVAYVDSLITK